MRTLAIHFDSVVHAYTSPFERASIIPDVPVPGAFAFIQRMSEYFEIIILSPRAGSLPGQQAMRGWMHYWRPIVAKNMPVEVIDRIKFYSVPPYFAVLDPRAMTFRGAFPDHLKLLNTVTWNRKEAT